MSLHHEDDDNASGGAALAANLLGLITGSATVVSLVPAITRSLYLLN